MKTTLLAVATLASLGFSSASMATAMPIGSAAFQWAGSVPASITSGTGYWIVKDGALAMDAGLLKFDNTGGENGVVLNSSSEIGFKVVKDDGVAGTFEKEVDVLPLAYTAVLSSVKVGVNGLASEQAADGYFAVHANGATEATVIGGSIEKTTKATRLMLKAKTGINSNLEAGDDVVVMVAMTITPDNA